MAKAVILALIAGLTLAPSVWADGFDEIDFSFTAPGGSIPDQGVVVFPLFMNLDFGNLAHVDFIESIELEIAGLGHSSPSDLRVFLIDPFAHTIEIMTDLGGVTPISDVTLVFNDKSLAVPGEPIESGAFLPEGLFNGTDDGMSTFVGGPNAGGTETWLLLMIDGAPGDTGGFESFTLRGTVPEPVTLWLLALGALAIVRRRRR